jgi:hypothetical protein
MIQLLLTSVSSLVCCDTFVVPSMRYPNTGNVPIKHFTGAYKGRAGSLPFHYEAVSETASPGLMQP